MTLNEIIGITRENIEDIANAVEDSYIVYPLKKGSKTRWIEAPCAELKRIQRLLLDKLAYTVNASQYAHGFVPGRSIVTHAALHCGREFVVTADIRNFFPSVTAEMVSSAAAEFSLEKADTEIFTRLVTRGGRLRTSHLPQGAPTSPHLANLVFRDADAHLSAFAKENGWTYSRYADDMAFSGNGDARKLLVGVEEIVAESGFSLSRRKNRIMPSSGRQSVTGLVVNEKPAVPREQRRLLRAALHRLDLTGPGAVEFPAGTAGLLGRLAFLTFVSPKLGNESLERLKTLLREEG